LMGRIEGRVILRAILDFQGKTKISLALSEV
jgi:hypothetical protein